MVAGKSTGWPALDPYYKVASGQLCTVTGIPGSGKSEWLDNLAINLAHKHGMGFAVFSPENYPLELHIQKLAEKLIGKGYFHSSRDEIEKALDFLHEHFYFVAHTDSPTLAEITEDAAALMLADDKVRGLILDPWNEIEHRRPPQFSETEYTSWVLSILRQFARIQEADIYVQKVRFKHAGRLGRVTPRYCYESGRFF